MSDNNLIKTKEALSILGITNHRYLNYLYKRGLLSRVYLGDRLIRYKAEEVKRLLVYAEKNPLYLTRKPDGVK